jgi:hypothetical protein
MSGGIFLIRDDGGLVEMSEQAYDSEELLQGLLADHPSVLAGTHIGGSAPRRWLLIRREMSVPAEDAGAARWSLDHLFIDQDGIPTLVEVKRSTDTRIRREVVGQMLDYAANAVVYWPVEELQRVFEERCGAAKKEPEAEVASQLGVDVEYEKLWSDVETNLKAGRVRLVFIADEIPAELQRIIEFLDGQMAQAEVLGVEIRQYVAADGGSRTLVPRRVGQTAQAAIQKGRTRRAIGRQWDEETFFADLAGRAEPEAGPIARRVLEWGRERGLRIFWGSGAIDGSLIPVLDTNNTGYWLATVWTYGRIEFAFQSLRTRPPFDDEQRRRSLLERLNEVPGITLPLDSFNRRPAVPLAAIAAAGSIDELLQVWDDVLNAARGVSSGRS